MMHVECYEFRVYLLIFFVEAISSTVVFHRHFRTQETCKNTMGDHFSMHKERQETTLARMDAEVKQPRARS